MSIITLLTDFGQNDVYVGMMKGVILKINHRANIIDLCHQVQPQNLIQAAFLLETSYSYFPQKTIHVVVVDPGVGSRRKIIAAQSSDFFFIAPDNGVLSWALAREKNLRVVAVENRGYYLPEVSATFHGRDIVAPAAAHLSLGVPLNSFGPAVEFHELKKPHPRVTKRAIRGQVIHIDRFGNLITNIHRDHLDRLSGQINIRVGSALISGLSHYYAQGRPGALVALIGSSGYLEIGRRDGRAADALGIEEKAAFSAQVEVESS